MENLKGRYIKVLRKELGGYSSKYEVGDYLEITSDEGGICISVEYAGKLHVRGGNNTRIEQGDIEIMPIGFNPLNQNNHYEIY